MNKARILKHKKDRHVYDHEHAVLAQIIPRQILSSSTTSVSSYLQIMKDQAFERPTH